MSNKYLVKIAKIQSESKQTELRPHHIRSLKKLDKENGLLIDHSMGSGKTLLMLKAIEKAQLRNKKDSALAIVPASLASNMDKEIEKHHLKIDLKRLNVTTYDKAVNDADSLRKKHHSIVVVDEAHRLRNTGTQRHKELREIIENADQRVLATGTTRYNHVSDMAPLINIVAKRKVLPEGKAEFEKEFVVRKSEHPGLLARVLLGASPKETQILKNNKYLKKVLDKHVDYYDVKDDPKMNKFFPKSTEKHVEVEMSPEQRSLYKYMEGKMPAILRWKMRMGMPLDKKESSNLNAFSSGIRQVSDSAKPFMPNSSSTSPKVMAMVDSIEKRKKGDKNFRGIAYSNYREAGLDELSKELSRRNIKHGVYHGGLNKTEKDKIRDDYNSGKLPMMLISSSGSEGLDLKKTRLVQVMEPHFNGSKIDQVVARGIRFKSHEGLPEKDKQVDVEHYHSVHPKGFFGGRPHSIDQYLHHNSKSKNDLNDQVTELMRV